MNVDVLICNVRVILPTSCTATTEKSMRIAFLGDLEGYDPLIRTLRRLGVRIRPLTWPDELIVVQVGHRMNRGPRSERGAELADLLTERFPGRFVDLTGNHDPGRPRPRQTVAVGLRFGTGHSVVVTHGGITRDWFFRYTSRTTDALELSEELNGMWNANHPACQRRGMVGLTGSIPDRTAGPLWAHVGYEVAPSWEDVGGPPFGQVVGHTGLVWWERGLPTHSCRTATVTQSRERRHSVAAFPNRMRIWAVDGSLLHREDPQLDPLMMYGVVETSSVRQDHLEPSTANLEYAKPVGSRA